MRYKCRSLSPSPYDDTSLDPPLILTYGQLRTWFKGKGKGKGREGGGPISKEKKILKNKRKLLTW